MLHAHTKHIAKLYRSIGQMIEDGLITLHKISAIQNLTDALINISTPSYGVTEIKGASLALEMGGC